MPTEKELGTLKTESLYPSVHSINPFTRLNGKRVQADIPQDILSPISDKTTVSRTDGGSDGTRYTHVTGYVARKIVAIDRPVSDAKATIQRASCRAVEIVEHATDRLRSEIRGELHL